MKGDNRLPQTRVLHVEDVDLHAVAVAGLHVIITPDGDGFHAQALEIDYAASGESIEDVKEAFVYGFLETIRTHLSKFGDLTRFVRRQAPGEVWAEFLTRETGDVLSCVTVVPREDGSYLPPRLRHIEFIGPYAHA